MKSLLIFLPFSIFAQNCLLELDLKAPLTLECTGKYKIVHNSDFLESRFPKKATLSVTNYGLSWGDEINPYNTFTLTPLAESRVLLNGHQYPGSFEFSCYHNVINHVDVNLVVQALMEHQELAHYSLDTLKALAVTLRTDLCFESKTLNAQALGYSGSSLLYQYPKVVQAVHETHNQVMTLDEALFPTSYCEDAAGTNASFSHIFRQQTPTPKGQTLPKTTTTTWTKVLTKQELCDQLKIKQLKHLFFYKDKNSSKLYAVKIEDENGSRAVLIQRFMELLDLKSNQFELTSTPTTFTFSGQGSGLGVGLCLKTAEALAEKGADYKKILETCYPSIKMVLLDK